MPSFDARYQKADSAIRQAFFGLFEQKGIEEITASEIIRASGVNRSTFYAHYADKFALVEAVERDFLAELEHILEGSPTIGLLQGRESERSAWEGYFRRLIDFLSANRQLFAGLASRKDSSFMAGFTSAFARALTETGAASSLRIPLDYWSSMLAWATAGLLDAWVRTGLADDRDNIVRILVEAAMGIQDAVLG